MSRVLVVDDDPALLRALAINLRARHFDVDTAADGATALRHAASSPPDLVVLDLGLPDMDGVDVCRVLRRRSDVAIIVVTARGEEADRVLALDEGADDYLGKPFDYEELVARVLALARRSTRALPPVLVNGGLVLDQARRQVSRDGRHLRLSPKEFAVLRELMAARGAVVSAEELLERAWDENTDLFTNAVRIAMSKLRAKLGEPPLIQTVPGAGYLIPVPEDAS
jgi:DNA-binding response OmpR family regulator